MAGTISVEMSGMARIRIPNGEAWHGEINNKALKART